MTITDHWKRVREMELSALSCNKIHYKVSSKKKKEMRKQTNNFVYGE